MTTLEPLYTLKVAAELIPFVHVGALADWLYRHRHEFPAHEMPIGRRFLRVLSLSEVSRIRSMRIAQGQLRRERVKSHRRTRPSNAASQRS
jgi:hypothetical protein